ncbi:hypothetical protein M3J09_006481 [Ascochyta lentis]
MGLLCWGSATLGCGEYLGVDETRKRDGMSMRKLWSRSDCYVCALQATGYTHERYPGARSLPHGSELE